MFPALSLAVFYNQSRADFNPCGCIDSCLDVLLLEVERNRRHDAGALLVFDGLAHRFGGK